jgi:hypothetical protein
MQFLRIHITSSVAINTIQTYLPCTFKKLPHIAHYVLEFYTEWRRKNSFSGFNNSMHSHVITVAPPAAGIFGDKYSLIIAK